VILMEKSRSSSVLLFKHEGDKRWGSATGGEVKRGLKRKGPSLLRGFVPSGNTPQEGRSEKKGVLKKKESLLPQREPGRKGNKKKDGKTTSKNSSASPSL